MMDRSDSKASDYERRASVRHSMRASIQGGEDDYDLHAMTIADGFRPTNHHNEGPQLSATPSNNSISTTIVASSDPPSPSRPSPARPSSIAKPRTHDSLALRHDGGMGYVSASRPTRASSVSTVTTATTATTATPYVYNETPYQGPSGPSFPYQMYPQNVRAARTLSVTTTSTSEPTVSEQTYSGHRGPTHPYGMYPQGTGPVPNTAPDAHISVGFPGIPDSYQRRLGPDGEEVADMIGPDGHTEQLPPYTRYPEGSYGPKAPAVVPEEPLEASATTPASSASPIQAVQPIPGAGGIGLAPRNPEFDSTDDLDSPRSRLSTRSFASDSHHEINTAALPTISEKEPQKKWQKRARKKLWGVVPYWAICLVVVALLLMGVILGAVMGTFLAHHKRPVPPKSDADGTATATTTVESEVTPIPTPTDLPALPEGKFVLPLNVFTTENTCINDTDYSQAWTCNLVFPNIMLLDISDMAADDPRQARYTASATANESNTMNGNVYVYGSQYPIFPDLQPLTLVNDSSEPNRGPAWHRSERYEKVVIVQNGVFPPPFQTSSKQRRHVGSGGPPAFGVPNFERKDQAKDSDMPWICRWPDTEISIFIYPEKNNSFDRPQLSSSSSEIAGFTVPTPTASFDDDTEYSGFPTVETATGGARALETGHYQVPVFSKTVKVEERRLPKSSHPTCTQVELSQMASGGFSAKEVINPKTGEPVVVVIGEIESDADAEAPSKHRRANIWPQLRTRDDDDDDTQCGCTWWLT